MHLKLSLINGLIVKLDYVIYVKSEK